ncbi:MAG: hypothetical protein ACTSRS_17465 [Candidatus Helarchaeota archaeon]
MCVTPPLHNELASPTSFRLGLSDYIEEPYEKVWIIKETGGIADITWELADWYNPNFAMTPPPVEDGVRYANGSRIFITGNGFNIDYNTDVFLVTLNGNATLKQHFQMIYTYYGADGVWHNSGMDFRGFAITVNSNKTGQQVMDDGDGASFVKASFQYTTMSYSITENSTLLNWNITVPDYKLENTQVGDQFYGSQVEMSILIVYQILITATDVKINTDWYIDFLNWTLVNTPDTVYLHTGRVYTCSDEGELNNTDRIGVFSNGGIVTSAFRLENDYELTYNDSSSTIKSVTTLIENDGIANGLPENDYWAFLLWFEGLGENVTHLLYDPIVTLYVSPPPPFDLIFWLLVTILPTIAVVTYIFLKKRHKPPK